MLPTEPLERERVLLQMKLQEVLIAGGDALFEADKTANVANMLIAESAALTGDMVWRVLDLIEHQEGGFSGAGFADRQEAREVLTDYALNRLIRVIDQLDNNDKIVASQTAEAIQ